jgi:hypothetical protein
MSALVVVGSLAAGAVTSQASASLPLRPLGSHLAGFATNPISHSVSTTRRYQLGIDVDFYAYPGENVSQYASADIQYVKSLHANALSVSFPFFVSGPKASSVHASLWTPSPAELAILAQDAKSAGLYFSIRPLLDETTLRKAHSSRNGYVPPNLAKWFASYEQFLKPYAQMAQKYGIREFVTGTELTSFSGSRNWAKLDTFLRQYYHGTLAYSNNWNVAIPKRVNASGVVQTDDAYPVTRVPDSASVARLTAAWDSYLRTRPSGIVLSEVGIAAQSGAYRVPYNVVWNGKPLQPAIQVHWFDAVCNAVVNEHDAGVYFWALGFGQSLNTPPSKSDPASWVDGPGQKAISACFKRLGG